MFVLKTADLYSGSGFGILSSRVEFRADLGHHKLGSVWYGDYVVLNPHRGGNSVWLATVGDSRAMLFETHSNTVYPDQQSCASNSQNC